jgi:hypothetical protein
MGLPAVPLPVVSNYRDFAPGSSEVEIIQRVTVIVRFVTEFDIPVNDSFCFFVYNFTFGGITAFNRKLLQFRALRRQTQTLFVSNQSVSRIAYFRPVDCDQACLVVVLSAYRGAFAVLTQPGFELGSFLERSGRVFERPYIYHARFHIESLAHPQNVVPRFHTPGYSCDSQNGKMISAGPYPYNNILMMGLNVDAHCTRAFMRIKLRSIAAQRQYLNGSQPVFGRNVRFSQSQTNDIAQIPPRRIVVILQYTEGIVSSGSR